MRLNIPDQRALADFMGIGLAVARLHGRSEGEADFNRHVIEPYLEWLRRELGYVSVKNLRTRMEKTRDSMLEDWREEEVTEWLKEHPR